MRELEFRVFDKRYKKYVKPYAVCPDGKAIVITEPSNDLETLCSERAIIEQSTGLKDKNGKEIYEGDIVSYIRHFHSIIPQESRTEIVSWRSGEEEQYPNCTTSGFSLPYSEDGYEVIGNVHENKELSELEVIGNIHENKELLEGKE